MPSNNLMLCHPIFYYLQSFPASGSFLMSQLYTSDGQRIGASAWASVPPMSIPNWFPLGLTGLIPLQYKGLQSLLQYCSSKTWILWHSAFLYGATLISLYDYIDLTRQTFVGKVMSLLFNMLSRLVTAILPWSKHLLISWMQSPLAVILEPKKRNSLFPLFLHLFAMKWWDWMP